ncbi:hypothetical protein NQZ68_004782 [Dissostichus eleginoides]|nr:hypothetical protein NQZ68_004782 [Dissostichus eleginoides]
MDDQVCKPIGVYQAAYGAQLYRSVLAMVRHACAERRQRGRAARHSLRVRCGFLAQPEKQGEGDMGVDKGEMEGKGGDQG